VSNLAEADPPDAAAPHTPQLLRDRSRSQRVTNIELFFDLVYVYAVTQLSHYLLGHSTVAGALQAGLLLIMVWLVWSYTTWVTNWLDPQQMAVRLLLVVLMLISLAMSASLPRAFEDLGLWIGGAYAAQQIGRTVFMVIALRGDRLQANFKRVLAWCVVSSAFALGGGFAHGLTRELLWLGSVTVDLAGGLVGFATPWLGRSRTSAWMILGGPALFLLGHAAFKFVVWRVVSWPRIAGIAGLALLALASRAIPALALAACAAGLVAAVAATDRIPWLPRPGDDNPMAAAAGTT
jgi:low temperature requirement protein LtrA